MERIFKFISPNSFKLNTEQRNFINLTLLYCVLWTWFAFSHQLIRNSTGCVCVPEQLCYMFPLSLAVHQHLPPAFRLCFRAQYSRTAGVIRLRVFAVITESSATAASENLWSVDFRPSSAHNDGLFMKFGEIWSGVNTECFILKLTLFSDTTDQDTCFHVVSVSDFLSCLTCSALNCCVVFHLHHQWQKHKPCISATDGSGSPEQRRGGNTTQPQPLEAHTLTRIETYQLHCRSGAETQHTCIWWNLGASLHSVD